MNLIFLVVGVCLLCGGHIGWGVACLVLAALTS